MDHFAQPMLIAMLAANVARWVVWGGLVAATIALLVLMRTQWGSSQPLRKCIVLSLLVHLLFGIYTTTVSIVVASIGKDNGGDAMWVSLDGATSGDDDARGDVEFHGQAAADPAWNQFARPESMEDRLQVPKLRDDSPIDKMPGTLPKLDASPLDRVVEKSIDRAEKLQVPELDSPRIADRKPADRAAAEESSAAMRSEQSADPSFDAPNTPDRFAANRPTDPALKGPTDLPRSPLEMAADLVPPRIEADELPPNGAGNSGPIADRPASSGTSGESLEGALTPIVKGGGEGGNGSVPTIMKGRVGADRLQRAIANGGSQDTEAAVVAALKWLAEHQGRDGRWDADQFEAGREVMINGHDRRGAGSHADSGITGLALLALLAHGNTHLKGEHPQSVQRGLEWLLSIQGADGNLADDATIYERMYCHAMATCALSEAYAMSGDDRLAAPVRQAIGYCIRAQDRVGGGWRYQPGDAGDTSQLGWQVMALKSAQLAGIEVPSETRNGMVRFLKNVASGTHGGLASYKPGHRVTHTMTAEALVCRQFIGMGRNNPASNEAGDYVLTSLPGDGEENVYYWYYGTLGMFQLQGNYWKTWNKAIQDSLLGSQRTDGQLRGSWDPDRVWGAYGGRVYSTALSCLCLEVYYRFLPLYVEAASRERRTE
jgi:hypothetical protein